MSCLSWRASLKQRSADISSLLKSKPRTSVQVQAHASTVSALLLAIFCSCVKTACARAAPAPVVPPSMSHGAYVRTPLTKLNLHDVEPPLLRGYTHPISHRVCTQHIFKLISSNCDFQVTVQVVVVAAFVVWTARGVAFATDMS